MLIKIRPSHIQSPPIKTIQSIAGQLSASCSIFVPFIRSGLARMMHNSQFWSIAFCFRRTCSGIKSQTDTVEHIPFLLITNESKNTIISINVYVFLIDTSHLIIDTVFIEMTHYTGWFTEKEQLPLKTQCQFSRVMVIYSLMHINCAALRPVNDSPVRNYLFYAGDSSQVQFACNAFYRMNGAWCAISKSSKITSSSMLNQCTSLSLKQMCSEKRICNRRLKTKWINQAWKRTLLLLVIPFIIILIYSCMPNSRKHTLRCAPATLLGSAWPSFSNERPNTLDSECLRARVLYMWLSSCVFYCCCCCSWASCPAFHRPNRTRCVWRVSWSLKTAYPKDITKGVVVGAIRTSKRLKSNRESDSVAWPNAYGLAGASESM